MGRHWRNPARRCSAVILAVAVVVPAASGVAAVAQTSADPAKLVGRWTRTVTDADIQRTGSAIPAGAVCTLAIKASKFRTGRYRGWLPARSFCDQGDRRIGSDVGYIIPTGRNRVEISLGWPSKNAYKWRISGGLLTFTRLYDDAGAVDREAAIVGVWQRT